MSRRTRSIRPCVTSFWINSSWHAHARPGRAVLLACPWRRSNVFAIGSPSCGEVGSCMPSPWPTLRRSSTSRHPLRASPPCDVTLSGQPRGAMPRSSVNLRIRGPVAGLCSAGLAQHAVVDVKIEPLGLAGIYRRISRKRGMTHILVRKLLRDLRVGLWFRLLAAGGVSGLVGACDAADLRFGPNPRFAAAIRSVDRHDPRPRFFKARARSFRRSSAAKTFASTMPPT